MLTIQLLGPPLITRAGHPIGISRRRSRAVLYYLAAHHAPVARETLMDLLWPDNLRSAAQAGLRTALHTLRQQLGDGVQATQEYLALAPNLVIDTQQLEQAAAATQPNVSTLTAALDQYRGPFLDGFAFPEAPPFDDWIVTMRERYTRLVIRSLTLLSRQYDAQQEWSAALVSVERALTFDSLQEDLQRAAMRLQYLAGDRTGAIRRYEYVRNLLDDELGVPPMAETQAMYDAIITDTLAPPPRMATPVASKRVSSPVPLTPFVGRDAKLAYLHTLIGSASCILIEGEAGIGKTRLVTEWLQETARQTQAGHTSPLILRGTARELAHHVLYQPLMDAMRSLLTQAQWLDLRTLLQEAIPFWLGEFACLLPEVAPAQATLTSALSTLADPLPHVLDETRLWESVTQALVALAQRQPIILLIDDLHWADQPTLSFLDYFLRQVAQRGSPITVVVTARLVAAHSALGTFILSLMRTNQLVRVTLNRLDPMAIYALSAHLSAAYTEELAAWLTETSAGNPYMLTELVYDAQARGVLGRDGQVDIAHLRGALPPTIAALVQTRYAPLPDTARRMLAIGALVGLHFDVDVVARAALLSDEAALAALDAAQAVGLVMPSDGMRYAFDHILTQEVIRDTLGEPQRRLLHRRIGAALEQVAQCHLDDAAPQIAYHYIVGHVPERAAPFALRAGQQALRVGGWADGIYWYTQALSVLSADQHVQTLSQLGQIYVHAGQVDDAVATLSQARDTAFMQGQNEEAIRVMIGLIELLIFQGRYHDALVVAWEGQTIQVPDCLVENDFLHGVALALAGRDLDAAAAHLHAGHTALAADTTRDSANLHAHILYELATVRAEQGQLTEAIGWYRETIAVAQRTPSASMVYWHTFALNALAYHLHLQSDPTAQAYAQEALDLAQQHRTQGPLAFIHSTLGELALDDDLDVAEQHFQVGLDLATQLNLTERIAGLTATLGRLAVCREHPELAARHFATALDIATRAQIPHLITTIQLWRAPLLPPDEAHALLAQLRAQAEASGRRRLLENVVQLEQRLASQEAHPYSGVQNH